MSFSLGSGICIGNVSCSWPKLAVPEDVHNTFSVLSDARRSRERVVSFHSLSLSLFHSYLFFIPVLAFGSHSPLGTNEFVTENRLSLSLSPLFVFAFRSLELWDLYLRTISYACRIQVDDMGERKEKKERETETHIHTLLLFSIIVDDFVEFAHLLLMFRKSIRSTFRYHPFFFLVVYVLECEEQG